MQKKTASFLHNHNRRRLFIYLPWFSPPLPYFSPPPPFLSFVPNTLLSPTLLLLCLLKAELSLFFPPPHLSLSLFPIISYLALSEASWCILNYVCAVSVVYFLVTKYLLSALMEKLLSEKSQWSKNRTQFISFAVCLMLFPLFTWIFQATVLSQPRCSSL